MLLRTRFLRSISVFFGMALMLACVICIGAGGADAAIRYVTQSGAGLKNGSSWGHAYGEELFPAAILSAGAGDEFWVRKGVYRPSTTTDTAVSFVLKSGVALYGGFSGSEALRTLRNPESNRTILTGTLQTTTTAK